MRKKGFTFIELLLSLAILGILFVPMMQLFSHSLYSSSASKKIITADNLAKWYIEKFKNLKLSKKEIKEAGNKIYPAEAEPAFEVNGIRWRIERQVVEETDPLEVRVSVYSQSQPAEPIITLFTLIEDKTWIEYKPVQ
ncbi:MAG: prepilin-type N-terminal cleavage/methylation domain-containing protein [Candidatus Omnitrophica bacterium]|nr:prepilin-type N-terminal cleavage/methylation domain-containing protein [Candidatus Omnitrophota bacterium]